MALRVGCCGFPVGRAEYFRRLDTVEINSSFYDLPRLATAEGWRKQAPEGFVYSLKAWQAVTHRPSSPTYRRLRGKIPEKTLSRFGHFQDTLEVWEAWEKTRAIVEALKAKFVLFQTPPDFSPGADHLRDIYRFFKKIRRGQALLVWEPRGAGWTDRLVKKVCEDLGLIHGTDPLARTQLAGSMGYFRLHGAYEGGRIRYAHDYSDAELERLRSLCGRGPAFVYFNNTAMWRDSLRFRAP